jgi:hypothetical protein
MPQHKFNTFRRGRIIFDEKYPHKNPQWQLNTCGNKLVNLMLPKNSICVNYWSNWRYLFKAVARRADSPCRATAVCQLLYSSCVKS